MRIPGSGGGDDRRGGILLRKRVAGRVGITRVLTGAVSEPAGPGTNAGTVDENACVDATKDVGAH